MRLLFRYDPQFPKKKEPGLSTDRPKHLCSAIERNFRYQASAKYILVEERATLFPLLTFLLFLFSN